MQTTPKPRDAAYNEIVNSTFQEFTLQERRFLLSLPPSDCKALNPHSLGPNQNLHLATQMRHHVEFLLTLKGIKPCMAIAHYTNTSVFTRNVNQILKPLMEKYRLEDYGFILKQVSRDTLIDGGGPTPFRFWKGGWIFGDSTSDLWTEVQDIFLNETTLNVSIQEYNAYQDRVGRVFGYPVQWPRDTGIETVVRYIDETETEALKREMGQDMDEVIGMGYFDDDGTDTTRRRCVRHFEDCKRAMESVGSVLRVDAEEHPSLNKLWDELKDGRV